MQQARVKALTATVLLLLGALVLALWRIQTLQQCAPVVVAATEKYTASPRWQFPSHRDPALHTYYQPQRQFFFEDGALGAATPELAALLRCYRLHCSEVSGREKGCSNYDYQDISVFQSLFLEPAPHRNGIFVELGAMNGWHASNTLFFERCLNWSGALFDISTDNYARMLTNRPSPTTAKILGTVCDSADGSGHVYVARTASGCCSKVDTTMDPSANRSDYVAVPCKPMSQWLRALGITAIDYFSLDTEGYEYEVLRSIDWSRNWVRVLSVEMLDRGLVGAREFENQARIRQLLGAVGLTYVPWLSVARDSLNRDEIWVNFSWVP